LPTLERPMKAYSGMASFGQAATEGLLEMNVTLVRFMMHA
jgi:hypothetical protein